MKRLTSHGPGYVVGSSEVVGVGVVLVGERSLCHKLGLEGSVCSAVGRRVNCAMFDLGNQDFVQWLLRYDQSTRELLVSKVICKRIDLFLYAMDVLYRL
jgi:hypothetical protein